jgi:hypothetical protein
VPEDEDDSIRPSQQLFVAKTIINDDIDSIEVLSIHPVPRQNPPGQHTLQRGESEEPIRIAPQNELHQPVAEAANAVVKKDGVRHGFGNIRNSNTGRIKDHLLVWGEHSLRQAQGKLCPPLLTLIFALRFVIPSAARNLLFPPTSTKLVTGSRWCDVGETRRD